MSDKKETKKEISWTVAKTPDGTVQINFTIPQKIVTKSLDEAISVLGKDIEVPGFRKGKAPADKVKSAIPQQTLIEKALSSVMPQAIGSAIDKEKLKPVMYPKLELIASPEDADWQIRATTAEMAEIKLGDYKKDVRGALSAKTLWTPDSGKDKNEKVELTLEQKEQIAIETLINSVKIDPPKILVEEEVNRRLSQLLERIEKLGLSLDGYLASVGKTTDAIRKDYEKDATEALKLDLILTKIASTEKIKIEKAQVDEAIKASSADPKLQESLDTPQQRAAIEAVLRKRMALASLI